MLPLSLSFAFSEGRGKHRTQDTQGSAPKPEPLKRKEKGRRELGDPPGGRATKKTGLGRSHELHQHDARSWRHSDGAATTPLKRHLWQHGVSSEPPSHHHRTNHMTFTLSDAA